MHRNSLGEVRLKVREVKAVSFTNGFPEQERIGTEWFNGGGIDFTLTNDNDVLSLHIDDIEAICKIAKELGYI